MKKIIICISFVFVLVIVAVSAYYFYTKYKESQVKPQEQLQQKPMNEIESLLKKVGKHIVLPTDENPTIFTVPDKEKLSGQQFFMHANNGDKVLIYEKNKKAFLYDVVSDKIIEVGPVTFETPAVSPLVTPSVRMPTKEASAAAGF